MGRVHQEDPEKLKATVKLAAGSEIEVTQDVAADLLATVDIAANQSVEVTQDTAADLKATVTQANKERLVTTSPVGVPSTIIQGFTGSHLTSYGHVIAAQHVLAHHYYWSGAQWKIKPWLDIAQADYVRLTDGTNTMPTMDAVERPGFMKLTDGVKTVGGVYDNITEKFSIATSRGAGKNTFAAWYTEEVGDALIVEPPGGKKIMVVGVLTTTNADSGFIHMYVGEQIVWMHFIDKVKSQCGFDMNITGVPNIGLYITCTQGEGKEVFVLVNYRIID